MTHYQKYVAKLRTGCQSAAVALTLLAQPPRANDKEDVNARIESLTRLISLLQDVKRYLYYFKNQTDGVSTPTPPKPPDPPSAA